MIASALSKLRDHEQKVVQEFLSDLLSGKYDSATIQAMWNDTSSDFFIPDDEELISFLNLIQKEISMTAR
jgi:hypothetical protein